LSGDSRSQAGPILSLRSLSKGFGGLKVFSDVSFDIEAGTVVGLIGPNGAGKSTLIGCVSGFLRPDSGSVKFEGSTITGIAPHTLCRAGVTRTFQHAYLLSHLSVLENVLVGCHVRARCGQVRALWRSRAVAAEEAALAASAMEALNSVGCAHLAHQKAGSLTAGQQRLVSVARALSSMPRVLLLDEPAAGLNESETTRLADALRSLRETGLTLLVIEHDIRLINAISDHLVVLADGGVIMEGEPAAVCAEPTVIKAYLGGLHAQ